jgi:hypothetical protein
MRKQECYSVLGLNLPAQRKNNIEAPGNAAIRLFTLKVLQRDKRNGSAFTLKIGSSC